MARTSNPPVPERVGRYHLFDEIASGGMATIHLGRLEGPVGFSRIVAVKRLHPQFAKDKDFVAMFIDEARVAGRIQHPNVVGVLDVVKREGELFLVMDYVLGEPLSKLLKLSKQRNTTPPAPIAAAIAASALHGLHAAHQTRGADGKLLEIVHRDVSPQNILVGADGSVRVVDFGIAKAIGRMQSTSEGQLKGKLGYFSPEQLQGDVDRRTDVFAASVVLWETLTCRRLFVGQTQWDIIREVLEKTVEDPHALDPSIPPQLAQVALRGLARDREQRFESAAAMAKAIEQAVRTASTAEIAEWVEGLAGPELDRRRERLRALEELEPVEAPPSTKAPSAVGATSPSAAAPKPASVPPSPQAAAVPPPPDRDATTARDARTPVTTPTEPAKDARSSWAKRRVWLLAALAALLCALGLGIALPSKRRVPWAVAPPAPPPTPLPELRPGAVLFARKLVTNALIAAPLGEGAAAIDASGSLLLGTTITDAWDLGAGLSPRPLDTATAALARFDAKGGALGSVLGSGGATSSVNGVAASDTTVLLSGTMTARPGAAANFGCGDVQGQGDAFLVAFDESERTEGEPPRLGRCRKQLQMTGSGITSGAAIAVHRASGDVAWLATASGPSELAGRSFDLPTTSLVTARLDATLSVVSVEPMLDATVTDVRVVGAAFSGADLLAALQASTLDDTSTSGVFVIEKGNPKGGVAFGGRGEQVITSLATDGDRVLIGGWFTEQLDLRVTRIEATLIPQGFALLYDRQGFRLLARRVLAGQGAVHVTSVAFGPDGGFFIAGDAVGTVDAGGQTFGQGGSEDAFIARYDANAAPVWARSFSASDKQTVSNLTLGEKTLFAVVSMSGTVAFDRFTVETKRLPQPVLLGLVP